VHEGVEAVLLLQAVGARRAFSLITSRLSCAISSCSGFI
jgi:hypothetical protein